jgi:hypothetical protein
MITTMRRTLAFLAIVSGLIFTAGQLFGQLATTGAGKKPGGAPAYAGPGDVVAGAIAWWGAALLQRGIYGQRCGRVCAG